MVKYTGEDKQNLYSTLKHGTVLDLVEEYPEDMGILVRTRTYPIYLVALFKGEYEEYEEWCCMACCEKGYAMHGHFKCIPTRTCGKGNHEPTTHGNLD